MSSGSETLGSNLYHLNKGIILASMCTFTLLCTITQVIAKPSLWQEDGGLVCTTLQVKHTQQCFHYTRLYLIIPDYTYTVYIVMQALPTWRLQACTNLTKSSDVSIVVSTNPN